MIKSFGKSLAIAFVALAAVTDGAAIAAPVTVGFEGVAPSGSEVIPVTPYTESGFTLTNSLGGGTDGIFSATSGANSNGTSIFGWCSFCGTTIITLSKDGGGAFNFLSFDSASLDGDNTSLDVVGHLFGGGTVNRSIFQDATWDTEILNFIGVTSVDFVFGKSGINDDFAIDNLTMSAYTVPEPGSFALLGLAWAALGFGRRSARVA